MELVPLDTQWAGSETKLDLKAWYRRPSAHGGFSLVGPLPLRRHLDWAHKGFEYVTLASIEDVAPVLPRLRAEGVVDIDALRKSYDRKGDFDVQTYLKTERARDEAFLLELQAKVDKFGVEMVTEMMQMQDPSFVMPDRIVSKPAPKAAK